MESHTFWAYSLASVFLVWGALGLRFALSVLAANAALAVLLFCLPAGTLGPAVRSALPFGYPVYLGAAFYALERLDRASLPSLPGGLRFFGGLLAALLFAAAANLPTLSYVWNMQCAVYLAGPKERPALLTKTLARSSYQQVCLDSHAPLMELALQARDRDVLRALLAAYDRCYSASATVGAVVKPLFDAGRTEEVSVLLESGLRPSSLVSGTPYKGTALAYAALEAKSRELVEAIVNHDRSDAQVLPFLHALVEALHERADTAMLHYLREEGVIPE